MLVSLYSIYMDIELYLLYIFINRGGDGADDNTVPSSSNRYPYHFI